MLKAIYTLLLGMGLIIWAVGYPAPNPTLASDHS